jgi:YHS domain-containing protein
MAWTGICGAIVGAAALCAVSAGWAAAGSKVNTGYFGGVALYGYDTVAYFTEGKPMKGSPDYRHDFLGETWQFATPEHRDLFAADPVAYAPQYGGFCAGEVASADVSTGITTNIDPESWKIIDGKLYLFYQPGYADHFEENAEELIEDAEAHWPGVEKRLLTQ